MITIRKDTFETNSSSCHAITFPKIDNIDIDDFYVSFTLAKDDEFTRCSSDSYNETYMKAKYLWTTICMIYDYKHMDTLYPIDKDSYKWWQLESYTPMSFRQITNVIRFYLGDKCDFENPSWTDMELISIDHQSLNRYNWILMVLKDRESLYNYLFNDKVTVYTTDDCTRDNLKIDNTIDLMHIECDDKDENDYEPKVTKYMHQIFDIGDQLKNTAAGIYLANPNIKWSNKARDIKDVLEDININLENISYALENFKNDR